MSQVLLSWTPVTEFNSQSSHEKNRSFRLRNSAPDLVFDFKKVEALVIGFYNWRNTVGSTLHK